MTHRRKPGWGGPRPGGKAAAGRGSRDGLTWAGHELRVSKPEKLFFPEPGFTKLDLIAYYIECEQAVVRHLRERPTVMKRWVDGVQGKPFFQKRVPGGAPDWIETATVTFPSGRHARELVPNDAAHLVWGVNLGVVDWNPWPVRRSDLDHPDELRIDLDPGPGVDFARVRRVALTVREVLEEHKLRGFPKTSGSRGIHVFVRVVPEQGFAELRRRRSRSRARSSGACRAKRRVAGGRRNAKGGVHRLQPECPRSHRGLRLLGTCGGGRARFCPLEWDEVAEVEPAELRIDTVPAGACASAATRAPRSTNVRARSPPCWSLRHGTSARAWVMPHGRLIS